MAKKSVIYTYKEQTISAASDLHEIHGRRSFHIASIKNQVKKNARKRKQKLGPHWNTFVTKAIRTMQDEGILKASKGSSGYFELSPASRKCFTDARKVFSALGSSSTELETALVKSVARGTPTKKRAREDDEHYTPTKRAKTTRLSTGLGGSPSRWMSKPKRELIAVIERLEAEAQEELERDDLDRSPPQIVGPRNGNQDLDLLKRPLSPLTEMGDDDDHSFELGETQLPDALDMSGPSTRPSTPVRSIVRTVAAPQPLRASDGLICARPLLGSGVSRTMSGSFLSHVSNRHTPSPGSDYGFNDNDITMASEATSNVFNNDRWLQTPTTMAHNRSQLLTPDSTPLRSPPDDSCETFAHGIAHEPVLREKVNALEEENRLLREKSVAHLSTISSMQVEIESLRAEKLTIEERAAVEFEAQTSTFQSALAESAVQHSHLNAQLTAGNEETHRLKGCLISKDQEITSLTGQLHDVNRTLEVRTGDLAIVQQLTAELQGEIVDLKGKLDAREAEFASKLLAAEKSVEASSAVLDEKVAEIDGLNDSLRVAQRSVEALRASLATTYASHAADIGQRDSTIAALRDLLSSAQSTVEDLRSEVSESTKMYDQLQTELDNTVSDRTRISDKLNAERVHSATVKEQLEHALAHIGEVEDELERMQTLQAVDAGTIQKLRNTIMRIQAAQMQSWAEATEEITEADPTPKAPSRARYSI